MGIKSMGIEGRGGYGRERRMRGIEGRIRGMDGVKKWWRRTGKGVGVKRRTIK